MTEQDTRELSAPESAPESAADEGSDEDIGKSGTPSDDA